MESKDLAIALARALDAKKARNIRILRVHDLTTVTDYFVIATGTSTTHVAALADEADFQLGRQGVNVLRTEGQDGKRGGTGSRGAGSTTVTLRGRPGGARKHAGACLVVSQSPLPAAKTRRCRRNAIKSRGGTRVWGEIKP